MCVAALAFGRRSEAFCGLRSGDGDDGGGGDFVTCLKAKAIAALDLVSRADSLPLTETVTLVRDEAHRRQRSDDGRTQVVVTEQELRSKPDEALDRMLYNKAVGLFSGRAVKIGLPELTSDQLKTAFEEGKNVLTRVLTAP